MLVPCRLHIRPSLMFKPLFPAAEPSLQLIQYPMISVILCTEVYASRAIPRSLPPHRGVDATASPLSRNQS